MDYLAELAKGEMVVIADVRQPTPIAFANVYEPGDLWLKIQGCDSCPKENRIKCCNNCGMFSERKGCVWHLERNSSKPWNCVIKPYPHAAMSFCSLEYQSIKGSKEGQIRRVCDPGDIFQEG